LTVKAYIILLFHALFWRF